MPLSEKDLLSLFNEEGPIAAALPQFEVRPEQVAMSKDVLKAFKSHKIALIEAGTGCGKSMAYLLPALFFCSKQNEKIVISTHTINLQEQLLEKDIPRVLKALNLSLKVVLVKGMHNYLCLRKVKETMEERLLYPPEEAREVEDIHEQIRTLKEGSKSELKVLPSYATWEKVQAESDTCTGKQCPYYQECYFFKARKEVGDAQVLIVNHHLLFADLSIKSTQTLQPINSILPPYARLIIDEAHHIEEVATEYFAKKVNRLYLLKTLGRLLNEGATGKIGQLKEKLVKHFAHNPAREDKSILDRLTLDLPGSKKALLTHLNEMFEAFYRLLETTHFQEEIKLRFFEHHAALPLWKEEIHPKTHRFSQELLKLDQTLNALEKDLEGLKRENLDEITASLRHEIKALSNRLIDSASTLALMMEPKIPENQVRWIEHSQNGPRLNTTLTDANLDLSKLFVENLFSKLNTVILSSATLTTDQQFDYFIHRYGLNLPEVSSKVTTSLYPSPYHYQKQALLSVPSDLPPPSAPQFIKEASEFILNLLEITKGGAFILFTSYAMLKSCYLQIEKKLKEKRLFPMKQGDASRKELLAQFTKNRYGILFGTDSFWEGVDVAGDNLRLVVIVKLPFKVPTEPLIQARMEKLKERGLDPFKEYSLPQAILKLKQGFGRLIRGKQDRGAIVILDSRLITKNYGKAFLSSLPKCQEVIGPQSSVIEAFKKFY